MLFRLGALGAVVVDIPIVSSYADEKSSLRIGGVMFEFLVKHVRNTFKRLIYRYLVRDFSIASLELVFGTALVGFGAAFGSLRWYESVMTGEPATAGVVMLAALPFIVGLQMLLAFLNYDIMFVPTRALFPALAVRREAERLVSAFDERDSRAAGTVKRSEK